MLIDTSGTYTRELRKAQQIINVLLSKLYPGDSFAVARIDTGSFSEKDIVAKVTFDDRPSKANQQKRIFKEEINKFVKSVKPASYTDITGGILQAAEYLNEKNPGQKTILIFSDLKEELDKRYNRDIQFKLKGYDVIALNVTKLRTDNFNPQEYLDRLQEWQIRVESGGGKWKVTNDMDQIDNILIN
ncbi:MAG: VWA domain-containing protein [Gammaproteobacteria bacterium]|nr:VWA domain-containing protein [Gammaproteobacteria bacterium]MDH5801168.1 VWA domain-containing protein [Gammaproteobacteria bacterium]